MTVLDWELLAVLEEADPLLFEELVRNLAFRKQTTHMQWVGRRREWEEDNPPGNVLENPREDEPFAGPFPWSVW